MLELGSTKLKLRIMHQFLKTNFPLVLISFDTSFKCGSENYHLAKYYCRRPEEHAVLIFRLLLYMCSTYVADNLLFLLPLRMNGMHSVIWSLTWNSITHNLITHILKILLAKCSIGARIFGFWSILPALPLMLGYYYWIKSQTACRKKGKHLPGNKIWKQATVHQKTPGQ